MVEAYRFEYSSEDLEPVASAVERVTGRRPSASTWHRWRLRGVRGVQLPTVLVGGRRLTSRAAVIAWLRRVNDLASTDPSPALTNGDAVEHAERYVECELGLKTRPE